jgi:hypothetical protein
MRWALGDPFYRPRSNRAAELRLELLEVGRNDPTVAPPPVSHA